MVVAWKYGASGSGIIRFAVVHGKSGEQCELKRFEHRVLAGVGVGEIGRNDGREQQHFTDERKGIVFSRL